MLTVLIIGLVLFAVFMVVSFSSAPFGYQDENGFHYNEQKVKRFKISKPTAGYLNSFQNEGI